MKRALLLTALEKTGAIALLCSLVSCSGGDTSGIMRSQLPPSHSIPAPHVQLSQPRLASPEPGQRHHERQNKPATSSYGLHADLLEPRHHEEAPPKNVKPAEKKPLPPSPEMVFQSNLSKADSAFTAMDYRRAERLYLALLAHHQGKHELHWKLARLYISTGESLPRSASAERRGWFGKAIEHARQCVRLDEHCARCHTWLAAALGVHADDLGAKEKIRNANIIKAELERALELDPNDDIAWSILGSFNREIAGIGWIERMFANTFLGEVPKGSYQEAERMFLKAISLNPDIIRHYYELGLLYREQKRYPEALRTFRIALAKPLQMKSDIQRKENMRRMIEKLSGIH